MVAVVAVVAAAMVPVTMELGRLGGRVEGLEGEEALGWREGMPHSAAGLGAIKRQKCAAASIAHTGRKPLCSDGDGTD